ncbi:MAG TPA: LPS export ABC transporter periplasmic protein LptC [Dongiaceae bacterium]|nr:LPS export ABC transporter periplasmic protein LptC [Dongiaceae bacterium]
MSLRVYRLRRILAVIAILLVVAVAGMYFYARSKAMNALKTIPGKIGYDIKQTAQGFQFSKSDGKRTLFTVQAKHVTEFKLNGQAELRNVSIVLYGKDSSRFDQIYGDDFAYNQKTGEVTAKGDVQIDLVANPAGLASPDQSTPKELRSPIHLKTRDLIFDKNSGNAWTNARVEWSTPQATGSAVGVRYSGKNNVLTLGSQIHLELSNPEKVVIDARHGTVTNDPRQIVLAAAEVTRSDGTLHADEATLFLSPESHVERVLATGNVKAEMRSETTNAKEGSEINGTADQAEFLLPGNEDLLRTATFSGNVHFEQSGAQQIHGEAGRVIFDFAGQNRLEKVHAVDGAHLTEQAASVANPEGKEAGVQDFELQAPEIHFLVADGRVLKQATTSGAAQITVLDSHSLKASASPTPGQRTVVTAGKFVANFAQIDGKNRIASIQGAPNARIVNSVPGLPDRVSISESVDAFFLPQGGIDSITQTGNVAYSDGRQPEKRMQAWADSGRYTPADHMLVLSGNPRVVNGGMETTALKIRINRGTGEALAEGDVKSTYSDLKEQPDGALLASSSPIHVTAQRVTARNSQAIARYTGAVRLWQDANVIEAPTIEFDRDHRSVIAQGTVANPVRTVLVQKPGKPDEQGENHQGRARPLEPVTITALKFSYTDAARKAHYDGGVRAKGDDFTASSRLLDAYLARKGGTAEKQESAGAGQLERMIAQGDVFLQQPDREARGQDLTYTASEDKFVLTGGPPSIFDAEQGKITGVSLTFFRRDDRVLVEGKTTAPVVTRTRVAR